MKKPANVIRLNENLDRMTKHVLLSCLDLHYSFRTYSDRLAMIAHSLAFRARPSSFPVPAGEFHIILALCLNGLWVGQASV